LNQAEAPGAVNRKGGRGKKRITTQAPKRQTGEKLGEEVGFEDTKKGKKEKEIESEAADLPALL